MRAKKFPTGMSLIELTIALAMFSVVMVIAVDSFNSVVKISRESVQRQALQDHAEFLFSLMTKEIKFAKISNTSDACNSFFLSTEPKFKVGPNQLYATSTDKKELRFINQYGDCIRYFLASDAGANGIQRLKVERHNPTANTTKSAWVTPLAVNVQGLFFEVVDMINSNTNKRQAPSVSYYLKLESVIWNPPTVDYFNYITARNIEQF